MIWFFIATFVSTTLFVMAILKMEDFIDETKSQTKA